MNTSRRNEVPATTQMRPQPDALHRVSEAVISVVKFARANGVRIEIDTVPRQGVPLAMGATDSVVRLWPAREEIDAEIASVTRVGHTLTEEQKAEHRAALRGSPGNPTEQVDLDPAGNPKLNLSPLERLAIDACNRVKAWAESDRKAPFPEDAHMLADGVLMMAAQRRRGVR